MAMAETMLTLWQFEELVSGKWEADEFGKW